MVELTLEIVDEVIWRKISIDGDNCYDSLSGA